MHSTKLQAQQVRPLVRRSVQRLMRLMPSVLLPLFIFCLIFVTLLQIAVIHVNRRAQYATKQQSIAVTSPASVLYKNSATDTVSNSQTNPLALTKQEPLRIAAILDNKAPSIRNNKMILQTHINSAQLRYLVELLSYKQNQWKCTTTTKGKKCTIKQEFARFLLVKDKTETKTYITYNDLDLHESENNLTNNLGIRQNNRLLYTEDNNILCSPVPFSLVGRLNLTFNTPTEDDILTLVPQLRLGGAWSPHTCKSRHHVAVIIPFRDREEHLLVLLRYLHPLLQRQLLDYRIFVVEQYGNETFNKGVLMNAGVRESLKEAAYHCFVFHDVDMIPEDDRNMYSCPQFPRHLSVAVNKFNYTLRKQKLNIIRPPQSIARYSMIKHTHRPESPNVIRSALLRMAQRRLTRDGLNTAKYRIEFKKELPLYTHIMVDIGNNHRWRFEEGKRVVISF
ncbi:beta-1,4-galactosyltransferase 2-like isoform X2 [Tachypleus tridentatus]|uniref:beta-1,4-galactosyltransferase 2-like isoform X2 n=1 Tax=Tachypleus tridentatus TaxID=6853 RepID=UPI003FD1D997